MNDITIRRAAEDDLDEILRVERACFSVPWQRSDFEILLGESADLFVAISADETVGYAAFDRVLGDEAELMNIAVAPRRRGQGVSKLLMDAMISSARENGVEKIMLEVRESNSVALALYEKYGFTTVGRRRGYYSKPREDALLMDLILEKTP